MLVRSAEQAFETDVLIIGAGPAGLTLANILGGYGMRTVVVEREANLVDYPRGVSIDDESLRIFQGAGVVDRVLPHTIPDQWIRYVTRRGRCFASVEPRRRDFGWPRRNAFVQPAVDRVLLEELARFDQVTVRFGHELQAFRQDAEGVDATINAGGDAYTIRAQFIVGCDGGRSTVRKLLDVGFSGSTDSTRWLVVDLRDDPLGIPDAYLFCDPRRPTVSMALPHAIRRFEFLVFDDETDEEVSSDQGIHRLLSLVLPNPEVAQIIRARVYTHHARIADRFVVSRALLAGDAAHLMPVWQGQGFNSGIRDASNIGWKITGIIRGLFAPALLETYDTERRGHAAAMISISVLVGRLFSPTNRILAATRDVVTLLLSALPSVKNYILQMKFKPMPVYKAGAVVPLASQGRMKAPSPIGRMFPQPFVRDTEGGQRRLDDVLGNWFSVISFGLDPRAAMDAEALQFWRGIGARFVAIVPPTAVRAFAPAATGGDLVVVGDCDTVCKDWFGTHQVAFAVLRPDRFVAAAGLASEIADVTRRLGVALCSVVETEAEAVVSRGVAGDAAAR